MGPTSIDLVNAFVRAGVHVEVLTGQIQPTTAQLDERVQVRQYCRYQKQSTTRRLISWLRYWLTTAVWLLVSVRKPAEVFAVTNPPMNLWTCWLLWRLRGVRYHLLIFDVYPEALTAYGFAHEGSWLIRIWRWLSQLAHQRAENVFAIGDTFNDVLQHYPSRRKVQVVPNWVDTEAIKPIAHSDNLFRKQHGLANKHVVLYSGNFGKTHEILALVQCARLLRNSEQIYFVLIGDGEQRGPTKAFVEQHQLKNVGFFPFQDGEDFVHSIACGDLAVVTLAEKAELLSIPSKTYYYMAAGSPILALTSPRSELAQLVNKHELGVVVPSSDPHQMATVIEHLLGDPVSLEQFGKNARRAAHNYTPENAERIRTAVMNAT